MKGLRHVVDRCIIEESLDWLRIHTHKRYRCFVFTVKFSVNVRGALIFGASLMMRTGEELQVFFLNCRRLLHC